MSNIKYSKREHIDELVCAAVNMLDCADLTPEQRTKVEQIYEMCGELEDSVEQLDPPPPSNHLTPEQQRLLDVLDRGPKVRLPPGTRKRSHHR